MAAFTAVEFAPTFLSKGRMMNRGDMARADPLRAAAARFGYWASFGTCAATLVAFVIAIATPPLSGPFCEQGCLSYPYANIADRFPRDYYWMFSAIVGLLFYLAFVLSLKARALPERRLWAEFGGVLAAMASLTLVGDYFVQLAVIQPSVLAHESEGVALLSQYNPHGIFIGLEELGYFLMSGSLASAAYALPGASRLERAVRWLCLAAPAACLVAAVLLFLFYGHRRAYLLEVALISIDWLILIVAALAMAVVFRRELAPA